jgi:hypothetical protein
MMRRATRAGGDQRRAIPGEAGDAVDACRLDGLGQSHRRQDGGEPSCQHRCARPWRSQEEDIVTARKLSLCNHIERKIVPIPM